MTGAETESEARGPRRSNRMKLPRMIRDRYALIAYRDGLAVVLGILLSAAGLAYSLTEGAARAATGWMFGGLIGLNIATLAFLSWQIRRANPRVKYFVARPAKLHELSVIHDMALRLISPDIASLNLMVRWHRIDQRIYYVLETIKHSDDGLQEREIVGYYNFFSLTRDAADRVLAGTLKADEVSRKEVSALSKKCDFLYIGGIAAVGGHDGVLISNAISALEAMRPRSRPMLLLTKPATRKGLIASTNLGFTAVDPSKNGKLNAVYSRELAAGESLLD